MNPLWIRQWDGKNVPPDLETNGLTLRWYFRNNFLKSISPGDKNHDKLSSMQSVNASREQCLIPINVILSYLK